MSIEAPAHLANPLRVLRQKDLQCLQLLRNTLDVVQPVHAHDDLASLESLFQLLQPRLNSRTTQTLDELRGVDTDRVGADLGETTLKFDTVRLGLETEDTRAGGKEVSSVVVCVETDISCVLIFGENLGGKKSLPNQVTLQDTEQDLTSDREDSAGEPRLILLRSMDVPVDFA